MSFQEINVREFSMKPFKMIGDQWMLVTAGNETAHNTLTASWGGLGVLWKKDRQLGRYRRHVGQKRGGNGNPPPALHQGICRIPRLLYPELLP